MEKFNKELGSQEAKKQMMEKMKNTENPRKLSPLYFPGFLAS